jgi:hypothetical protein
MPGSELGVLARRLNSFSFLRARTRGRRPRRRGSRTDRASADYHGDNSLGRRTIVSLYSIAAMTARPFLLQLRKDLEEGRRTEEEAREEADQILDDALAGAYESETYSIRTQLIAG